LLIYYRIERLLFRCSYKRWRMEANLL